MSTIKVVLRETKINESGEAPLYLRITKDRKAKFISLNFRIKPKDWNKKQSCVRKSYPNSERLTNFLAIKIAEATSVALDLEKESKYVHTKAIKSAILGKGSVSFFEFADKYLANIEKTSNIQTYNRKKVILNKLKEYVGKHDLTFDEINLNFLKNYEENLRDKHHNAVNSIHTDLKNIRTIINQAVLEDVINYEKNPFLKYKLKLTHTEKEYLTEDELLAFENLVLPENSIRNIHRNIFVFSTYAGGLRISDVFQLKWENFDGERIILNTQKSTTIVNIKLPLKAIEIINLYKTTTSKSSDFIFPFLKNDIDYSEPKVLYRALSTLTAATNKDLKVIAKKASINKNIHFHISRHTWATRALRKGMRIEYVSKLMGHSSIKTTQVYAKIVNDDLDKAMEVFN